MPETIYRYANSGIYHIINTISNKHYIGSAVDIIGRWYKHRSMLNRNIHDNQHLQAAWNKYGANAFEFVVIEYVDDPTQLTQIEQLYIDAYWASNELYNLCRIAGSQLGLKHSQEAKRRMSASQQDRKRLPHSPETRAKISAAHKGRHKTQESIQKHRVAITGKPRSEQTKAKLSVLNKGKPWSDNRRRAYEQSISLGVA